MCGIVAVLSPHQALPLAALLAMTRRLSHRGPDDEGYAVDDGVVVRHLFGRDTPDEVRAALFARASSADADALADEDSAAACAASPRVHAGLGHRRLAIVDLSPQGHQPMSRGALTLAFNGEIYDHVELRQELEGLGHRFQSHSDTEVLLQAWLEWGPEAFGRMNGMWSLAIIDHAERRLVVARDRYGVKPLYWWQGADGELALASEVKALLAHPRIESRPDLAACARILHAGPEAWKEHTCFEGVHHFPAGHWAEISLDQPLAVRPQAYWPPVETPAEGLDGPFDPAVADRLAREYRALLDDAVRIRMRMDVRFGTALSGGLDSSQIAVLVNDELKRRGREEQQEVFSSVYRGDSERRDAAYASELRAADESQFIAAVADHLGVHGNTIEPRWQDIPAEHERMIWALEIPPANTLMSSWHTYALVAQRGVVVTLDGQGADEQLAGYAYYVRNFLAHAPSALSLREARQLLRNIPRITAQVAAGMVAHAVRRCLGTPGLRALTQGLRRGHTLSLTLDQALRRDFATHLQTLLLYADKSAMAWSIESRMPFMDWRLVEFLQRLPLAYRVHEGWTKWLARHAMGERLPPSVLWRRDKLGWAIPEAAWFGPQGPLHDWLDGQIRSSAFALSVARAAGVALPRASLQLRLRLLNLAVWHRLFFEEDGRPGRRLGRGRTPGQVQEPTPPGRTVTP